VKLLPDSSALLSLLPDVDTKSRVVAS